MTTADGAAQAERLAEVHAKLRRVRRWLGETGRAAVLLASQSDFAWITAGGDNRVAVDAREGVGAVLVTGGRVPVDQQHRAAAAAR